MKIVLFISLLFIGGLFFDANSASSERPLIEFDGANIDQGPLNAFRTGTCTIKVTTKLDNGTTIEGTVTITSDEMNWFKCGMLKVYDFFSSDF